VVFLSGIKVSLRHPKHPLMIEQIDGVWHLHGDGREWLKRTMISTARLYCYGGVAPRFVWSDHAVMWCDREERRRAEQTRASRRVAGHHLEVGSMHSVVHKPRRMESSEKNCPANADIAGLGVL
jgi:hypothetical protein